MYSKISAIKTAPRFGLMIAGVGILITILMYVTGTITNQIVSSLLGFLNISLLTFFIYSAIKSHRDDQGGFISFGEGFSVGFLAAMIASFILMVFSYLLYKFIDPGLIDQIIEMQMDQPGMTEEAADMMEGFMTAEVMSISQIGLGLCCGSIISLIMALIMKNEPQDSQL